MGNPRNDERVVADSHLWIEHFNGNRNSHTLELQRLARAKKLWLAGPILCEVLTGPKREDQRRYLQSRMCLLPFLETTIRVWSIGVELFRLTSVRTRKVPWQDVLIAAHCIANEAALFTRDPHFDAFPTLSRHSINPAQEA